jgi:hypothetical protein
MVTINFGGRLGNNLLQYITAYLFSKKFNYNLNTEGVNNKLDFADFFKLKTHIGKIFQRHEIIVDNNNLINFLEKENIDDRHYIFSDYFQIREYIEIYLDEIISCFNPVETKIDDVFVVYRIGDIDNTRQMLPIDYYRDCLKELNFNKGFITSDTPNHPNIIELSKDFNLEIYKNECPMQTIDYARKFDKLILSEGTFSWWIGTLSKSNFVYYNERERFWHGDIYVDKHWIKKKFDY